MFTGIVRGLLEIIAIKWKHEVMSIALKGTPYELDNLQLGASISVDGTCLTVAKIDGTAIWFDLIPETLKRTTLANLQVGDVVNIERAARFGDEIGGHLLSGHVMGTAEVAQFIHLEEHSQLSCRVPPSWMKYLFLKGYIAINGASLTIVSVDPAGLFSVHLIPETLRLTNLGMKSEGEKLNIEIDNQTQAIVETVEKLMQNSFV